MSASVRRRAKAFERARPGAASPPSKVWMCCRISLVCSTSFGCARSEPPGHVPKNHMEAAPVFDEITGDPLNDPARVLVGQEPKGYNEVDSLDEVRLYSVHSCVALLLNRGGIGALAVSHMSCGWGGFRARVRVWEAVRVRVSCG